MILVHRYTLTMQCLIALSPRAEPLPFPTVAPHHGCMTRQSWTTDDLRRELAKYHEALLVAGNHRPSTITTYIQHPERFIAFLEGTYDPRQPQGRNASGRP